MTASRQQTDTTERRPDELRGIEAVAELPKLVRRILVYRGKDELQTSSGVCVWPVERFHAALAERALWPGS